MTTKNEHNPETYEQDWSKIPNKTQDKILDDLSILLRDFTDVHKIGLLPLLVAMGIVDRTIREAIEEDLVRKSLLSYLTEFGDVEKAKDLLFGAVDKDAKVAQMVELAPGVHALKGTREQCDNYFKMAEAEQKAGICPCPNCQAERLEKLKTEDKLN